jgi:hypothetical protein
MNDCIEWKYALSHNGYGLKRIGNKMVRVHRFVYEVCYGKIPDGLVIDHLCRNRKCINPHHLELTTIKENTLRGVGPTAMNAKKTHCKHGHEFNDENTYIRKDGRRNCKKCLSMASLKYYRHKVLNIDK